MVKNILLVGATGAIGSLVLKKLSANIEFEKIIVLSRKKIAIDDARIILIITDFQNLSSVEVGPLDVGLCALGTTIKIAGSPDAFKKIDHDLVIKVAELCKSLGAQNFSVVSALGASKDSSLFYNQIKGEMEADLKKLNFKTLTILRPSLLLGERSEFRLGEKLMMALAPFINPLLIGDLKKYRAIPMENVAEHLYESVFSKVSSIIENDKMT